MDDLQECFNEGKRKYHEKEIFDTFEEIQVNALRIAGKLKCGPFSRRQPKDKNLFFGRFLVSFEAKQVFHRTGPAGDLLSFSNLNAQIRQVLKKRKRAVEVAAWNEYKKQEVRKNTNLGFDQHYNISDEKTNLIKEIEFNQFGEAFSEKLNELDTKHKEVFTLRHVEGLSIKEIAEIVQINEGTVKSRIFYATKQLANLLKEYKTLTH